MKRRSLKRRAACCATVVPKSDKVPRGKDVSWSNRLCNPFRHEGPLDEDGSMPWKENTSRCVVLINELVLRTLYGILKTLSSRSNKERFETPQSVLTGQPLNEIKRWQNWTEEPICIQGVQGHQSNMVNP